MEAPITKKWIIEITWLFKHTHATRPTPSDTVLRWKAAAQAKPAIHVLLPLMRTLSLLLLLMADGGSVVVVVVVVGDSALVGHDVGPIAAPVSPFSCAMYAEV